MAKRAFFTAIIAIATLMTATAQVTVTTSIALIGKPKYAAGFDHYDYANPKAPKGGTLRLAAIGTYDNFNRYADRGVAAAGTGTPGDVNYIYDSLLDSSLDEISSCYPLIADKIEYPADFSWIIFHINPKARMQDGKKITADDVVFSFNKFATEGVPQIRQYYKGIKAEALDESRAKFTLVKGDKAMAIDLGSIKILPKSFWATRKLSDPLTEIPVGSSGYRIKDYKIGQYVEYQRDPNYWATDLPVNKGLYNFDAVRYDYYRDLTVSFEAFKAGEFDFYAESIAKNWATMYTGQQFEKKYIVKELIPDQSPTGLQAFVFNVQKPLFKDRRVREAIGYALDFEWLNKNYFYGQYTRSRSYFGNTDYEAKGTPGADELAVLNPVRAKIPAELFTKEYKPPVTAGTGNVRDQLKAAIELLKQAGWEINKDGKLANVKTGELFAFELLDYTSSFERVEAAMKKNLERMGITMTIRLVDTTQFVNRLRKLDYDLIQNGYDKMYYPDTNVQQIWRSDYIDSTWNTAGVQDPTIDYFVDGIMANQDNEKSLLAWGRAFDRVLTWNYYVIPMWHLGQYRIAYWNKFGKPDSVPKYNLGRIAWWYDPAKAAKLPKR